MEIAKTGNIFMINLHLLQNKKYNSKLKHVHTMQMIQLPTWCTLFQYIKIKINKTDLKLPHFPEYKNELNIKQRWLLKILRIILQYLAFVEGCDMLRLTRNGAVFQYLYFNSD